MDADSNYGREGDDAVMLKNVVQGLDASLTLKSSGNK